jgi:hypothetical protein
MGEGAQRIGDRERFRERLLLGYRPGTGRSHGDHHDVLGVGVHERRDRAHDGLRARRDPNAAAFRLECDDARRPEQEASALRRLRGLEAREGRSGRGFGAAVLVVHAVERLGGLGAAIFRVVVRIAVAVRARAAVELRIGASNAGHAPADVVLISDAVPVVIRIRAAVFVLEAVFVFATFRSFVGRIENAVLVAILQSAAR